jgi:hypothetical protein
MKERVFIVNDQILVRLPDGLAGLGSPPQAQLEALSGSGLLETDPPRSVAPRARHRRCSRCAVDRGGLAPCVRRHWAGSYVQIVFLDMAEDMFPVIEIDSGQSVEFILNRGVSLRLGEGTG